jgi:hypothetical protein
MQTVFRRIAAVCEIPYMAIQKDEGLQRRALVVPSVMFDAHSTFGNQHWVWEDSQCRVFHLIRDPRDVIISAMHYHSSASENWLHRPRKVFRGLSYQDKLKSLPDDRARFVFEMRHTSRRVIHAMHHWDYEQPNSLECRYEDLIEDVEGLKFTEVMLHLGFEQRESVLGRNIFRKNSLFGKKKRPNDTHIRSGARRQWESVFNRQSAKEFIQEFGDVLVKLGYEPDDSWIEALED